MRLSWLIRGQLQPSFLGLRGHSPMSLEVRWTTISKIVLRTIFWATTATDYFWRVSRSIDYSRMWFLNLSGKWISTEVLPPCIATVPGIKTQRISCVWFVHVPHDFHRRLILDCKRCGFWGFSSLKHRIGILLFPAFMRLQMKRKLLSTDGFIANDTVYGVEGLFNSHWERTISVVVSIVSWACFRVWGVMANTWSFDRYRVVRRSVDGLICGYSLWWRKNSDWGIARYHGLRGRYITIGTWKHWLVRIGVDNGNFRFSGKGLYVLRDSKSYFSTSHIDVDLEIEGVLTRLRGNRLVGDIVVLG